MFVSVILWALPKTSFFDRTQVLESALKGKVLP